jgi:hypothetical protein
LKHLGPAEPAVARSKHSVANHVYLITDASGLYKIGVASSMDIRLATIRSANPTATVVEVARAENAKALEQELHRRYANRRRAGEWFALEPQEVDAVIDYMRKLLPPDELDHLTLF